MKKEDDFLYYWRVQEMDDAHVFQFKPIMYQGKPSYEQFAKLHHIITALPCNTVEIDLCGYRYMHPSFAVLIASSLYLGDQYGKEIVIRYDIGNQRLCQFLKQSGICGRYYASKDDFQLNSQNSVIPFNRFKKIEDTYTTIEKIFNCAPVQLNRNLRNQLISKFAEVFSNAFEHGKSEIGVFCCGFAGRSDIFSFSVYDAGVGICANVNSYLPSPLSSEKAMEWAFDKAHSTLNGIVDYPRGAGLSLLENFARLNNGRIDVVSNDAYCKVTNKARKFKRLKSPIVGTIFSINIHADNSHVYLLD
jgi:hypothetical protein